MEEASGEKIFLDVHLFVSSFLLFLSSDATDVLMFVSLLVCHHHQQHQQQQHQHGFNYYSNLSPLFISVPVHILLLFLFF